MDGDSWGVGQSHTVTRRSGVAQSPKHFSTAFFHRPAAVNQPLQAPATSEAILNAINAVQAAACR
jgi:hypothetical protein